MNKPKLDKAKQWLLTVPPSAVQDSAKLKELSAKSGHQWRTVERALAEYKVKLAEREGIFGGTEKKKTPIVDQVKALRKLGWQESVERAAKENNLTTQQVWDEITRQKLAWRAKTGKLF